MRVLKVRPPIGVVPMGVVPIGVVVIRRRPLVFRTHRRNEDTKKNPSQPRVLKM